MSALNVVNQTDETFIRDERGKSMRTVPRLTDLEIKIMKVLWDSEKELTIQEIANELKEEKISAASVTQAMQRLTAKNAVKVSDYVLVVSSYTRMFVPAFTREEFMAEELNRLNRSLWGRGTSTIPNVVAALGFLKEKNTEKISVEDMKGLRQIIDDFIREE